MKIEYTLKKLIVKFGCKVFSLVIFLGSIPNMKFVSSLVIASIFEWSFYVKTSGSKFSLFVVTFKNKMVNNRSFHLYASSVINIKSTVFYRIKFCPVVVVNVSHFSLTFTCV